MRKDSMIKQELLANNHHHSTNQSKNFLNQQTNNQQPITIKNMLKHNNNNNTHNRQHFSHNLKNSFKYGRSSSLPLQIMIRESSPNHGANAAHGAQSWTDNSFLCDKLTGLINNQFSFSERFLDLLDLHNPNLFSLTSLSASSSSSSILNHTNFQFVNKFANKEKPTSQSKIDSSDEATSSSTTISSLNEDSPIANEKSLDITNNPPEIEEIKPQDEIQLVDEKEELLKSIQELKSELENKVDNHEKLSNLNLNESNTTTTTTTTNNDEISSLNTKELTLKNDEKEEDKKGPILNENEAVLEVEKDEVDENSQEESLHNFKPKKSCLKKSNFTIDTNIAESSNCTSKKRVCFADNAGKDLFTVRTMTEPSNCPPKLTSKIVQYFLNREFTNTANADFLFNNIQRNYENYGINALNYDMNKLSGQIAVYSLNFAQPASDYLNFRKRLDSSSISLENVVLNRFQCTGTVKVKNINYHKSVFVRCSFNGWRSFHDYQAQFVPSDYYTSTVSTTSANNNNNDNDNSLSAAFYEHTNNNYQPMHKDYDTFRFDFQLPKTVDQIGIVNGSDKNNATASIQFCVCYRSGAASEAKEFWDSNDGKNYEILQYIIDLERLKPASQATNTNNTNAQTTKSSKSNKSKNYDSSVYNYTSGLPYLAQDCGVYY